MKKVLEYLKKEMMLTISVLVAVISLFITKPSSELLKNIDWHTLITLFMMLTVLEGFKKENIFRPLLKSAEKITSMAGISFFVIFGVFFSSMFVTNDVSLIIFVPLTIILFRAGGKEKYILPVISMENIAAIRGSLLMPFGSPQNLFIFGQSGVSVWNFVFHMLPLWVSSQCIYSYSLQKRSSRKDCVGRKLCGAMESKKEKTKNRLYLSFCTYYINDYNKNALLAGIGSHCICNRIVV